MNPYEKAYQKFGEELPWCLEETPEWFIELIDSNCISPCRTLDIGCGTGDYARYLSSEGFRVLGIDASRKAIEIAQSKHCLQNLEFSVGNAFNLSALNQKFDLIYEVSLIHNISPKNRGQYVDNILSVLKSRGKFVVCCFSDQDESFKGKKELYFPDLDNTVYPLSRQELIDLFEDNFKFEEIKKIYFGKPNQRQKERWLCLLEKREDV